MNTDNQKALAAFPEIKDQKEINRELTWSSRLQKHLRNFLKKDPSPDIDLII